MRGWRGIFKKSPGLSSVEPEMVPSYAQTVPFNQSAKVHIVFVGSERRGLTGQGKTDPQKYFPAFEHGALGADATVSYYQTPSTFLQSINVHDGKPLAVIFLYNEEVVDDYPLESEVKLLSDRPCTVIYNSTAVAKIIAEKPVTNRILADAGVDVPTIMNHAGVEIFSNTNIGSNEPTSVVTQGSAVDPTRYNTELIDTRVKVDGGEYFVSLRAMCVGCQVLDVYVRCRSVQDGTPNVHSRNTPLDPNLLNLIYLEYVQPRMSEIYQICSTIGLTLGPGLYCHDILLSSDGRLPVCEVGFKFSDTTLVTHFQLIAPKLQFMRSSLDYRLAEDCARIIAMNTAKLTPLPDAQAST